MAEIQLIPDPTNTVAVATGLTGVAAAAAGSAIPVAGVLSITFKVVGISTATVTFQGSIDGGASWFNVLGYSSSAINVASTSSDGLWAMANQFALTHIRANITAWTAGTITVTALTRVR